MPSQERRLFVAHNLVAGSGTLVAGLLAFAFQSVISHRLQPAGFGAVFSVITTITFVTFFAGAFGRLVSWSTSRERAGAQVDSAAILASVNIRMLVLGVVIAIVMAALSPWISAFLHVSRAIVLVGLAGLPPQLAVVAVLGRLQGQQRFVSWGVLSVLVALLKLVCAVILSLKWGPTGVLAGLGLAAYITYGLALLYVRDMFKAPRHVSWEGLWQFVALMALSSIALTFALSADVIVVQHFFKPRQAGEYAAMAAVGRSIFWLLGGVGATVVFPKAAFRGAAGQRTTGVVTASSLLAVGCGLVAALFFGLLGKPVLSLFAGHAYVSGAAYLPWYAVGMAFLGGATVLVNAQQSLARAAMLWVLLPGALLKLILVVAFHHDLLQMTIAGDVGLGLLLAALAAVYARGEQAAPVRDERVPEKAALVAEPVGAE